MTKRKKNNNKKSQPKGSGSTFINQTVKERGRLATTVAISATANTYVLNEIGLSLNNFGSRATVLQDVFSEWKINSLTINMASAASVVNTATQAVSYYGNALGGVYFTPLVPSEYTAPTTFAQTVDFPNFAWGTSANRIHLHVNRSSITTLTPWLLTNVTGTTDSFPSVSGSLGFWTLSGGTSSIAGSFTIVVDYVLEFKGPVDPAVLPMVRSRILRLVKPKALSFEVVNKEEKKK